MVEYSNFCPGIPIRFSNSTLSDFDFSENKKLYKFIMKWLYNHHNGIWLYGKIGVGKTMLISIIARIIWARDYMNVVFINFSDLIESLRDYRTRDEIIEDILNCNYIFIDDFLKNFENNIYTTNDYRNLSMVIDKIYNDNKILVASSMYTKKDLLGVKGFDNMISRLASLCEFKKVNGTDRRV
jgi:DNA replication protein DnaC